MSVDDIISQVTGSRGRGKCDLASKQVALDRVGLRVFALTWDDAYGVESIGHAYLVD